MVIGAKSAVASARRAEGRFTRATGVLIGRLFGDPDVGTHVRWRAIRRRITGAPTIVDVACGDGSITLGVAEFAPDSTIRGIDRNAKAIAIAKQRQRDTGVHNISFEVGDVRDIEFGSVGEALLLDVIEHLDDDEALVVEVSRAVEQGGTIVISTPTPNFPRYFGRRFHDALGHVRDGYDPDEVSAMLRNAGCEVESVDHYFRVPAALCCAVFYRFLAGRKVGVAAAPVLTILTLLDAVWPWKRGAAELLVTGRKLRVISETPVSSE